jgi:pimeloyl-ACP methyl ester carboxylesterase
MEGRAVSRFLVLSPLLACASFHPGPLPGAPPDATFADIDGVRLRFEDEGDGPPILLIHGFGASIETWRHLIPALAQHHRVVAVDLKGFGWSDRPEGDYSPAAQAELIRALLDERGIEETAIAAHSWGASVALALANRAPDRVTHLVLYSAYVFEEQIPTFSRWARAGGIGEALFTMFYGERIEDRVASMYYDQSLVTEELIERIEDGIDRPGSMAAALAVVRGQRFAEMEIWYPTIRVPTLIIWGREDRISQPIYGERLARELPRARLISFPQCGHFPMLELPDATNREVLRFLEEPI